MIRLFYKGKEKGLQIIDLYKVTEGDKSEKLGDVLEKYWERELNNAKLNGRRPNLLKVLFKVFGPYFMMWGMVMFLQMMNR